MNNLSSGFDEFSKALSKATSGMDFSDAVKIADKLNISIDKFALRDGKFYLDDLELLEEAYIKYN